VADNDDEQATFTIAVTFGGVVPEEAEDEAEDEGPDLESGEWDNWDEDDDVLWEAMLAKAKKELEDESLADLIGEVLEAGPRPQVRIDGDLIQTSPGGHLNLYLIYMHNCCAEPFHLPDGRHRYNGFHIIQPEA
jgi:hypothetical protein